MGAIPAGSGVASGAGSGASAAGGSLGAVVALAAFGAGASPQPAAARKTARIAAARGFMAFVLPGGRERLTLALRAESRERRPDLS
jgi:hypothetical protein